MYKSQHVTALILARSGSSRLKDKMVLPFAGTTIVETVIQRIKCASLIDEFVFATTDEIADDIFIDIVASHGIPLYRGSCDDVVARMMGALGDKSTDIVVRVCSDNPLLMPTVVDEAIVSLVDAGADVITPFEYSTYPFGFSMVCMTRDCLQRIDRDAQLSIHREHVEKFCFEHPQDFSIIYQKAPEQLSFPQLVLTLDYETDYRRLQKLWPEIECVAIEQQPQALIDVVRARQIAIVSADADRCRGIFPSLKAVCLNAPLVFEDLKGVFKYLNQKEGAVDLLLCESSPADSDGADLAIDTVCVDIFDSDTNNRDNTVQFCWRYVDRANRSLRASDIALYSEQCESNTEESRADYFFRTLPLVLPVLLAGPARPTLVKK